jgi:LmbE family N-acetylglucosaminyl deacetylase
MRIISQIESEQTGAFAGAEECVIIAAHPDDETAGAAWLLQRVPVCTVIHLTDGAPIDPGLTEEAAVRARAAYARVRRREALQAMGLVGIPPERVHCLGVVDQEATFELAALTYLVAEILERLEPTLVAVHAYEGGHPDHDAAAFATHGACALLRQRGGKTPLLVEMTGYHAAGGELAVGQFVPGSGPAEVVARLTAEERTRKREMMACFVSQASVLGHYALDYERFRVSPRYDFTRPPHPGPLHYERIGWRMSGADWRLFACRALRELGLGGIASAAPS